MVPLQIFDWFFCFFTVLERKYSPETALNGMIVEKILSLNWLERYSLGLRVEEEVFLLFV